MANALTERLGVDERRIDRLTSARFVVGTYAAGIVIAEVVGLLWSSTFCLTIHAVLVLALLSHYILVSEAPDGQYGNPRDLRWHAEVLPILALLPLLRIFSLAMPIRGVPEMYWYVLVGAPLLVAMALAARVTDLSWADLGLRRVARSKWEIIVGSSGFPLGIVGFLLVRPHALVTGRSWTELAIASVILLVFTGLTEEIMFRGMVQRLMTSIFGQRGFWWSSGLFAVMYIAQRSFGYVLFAALVGCYFSWCVRRSGSIWGVAVAHGLLSLGMLIFWPLVYS